MSKILITSRSFGKTDPVPYELLHRAGYEIVNISSSFSQNAFEKAIPDFDALIIGAHPFPEKVMEKCKRLRIICKNGVGLDNIPIEKARELGIAVCNAPGTNSNAVADLTFGLMLSVARKIQCSCWSILRKTGASVIGVDVYRKTLGLLGFGAVARCVARRARGFDMPVLAYDPYVKELPEEFRESVRLCGFEEVLRSCDILSVHMPLTGETWHMIGRKQLAAMKQGSILINTARGGIVDEAALYEALVNGRLLAAGMDVVEQEPLSAENPLLSLDNVVMTPHIGMYSIEAVNAVGRICAENAAASLLGQPLVHRVV